MFPIYLLFSFISKSRSQYNARIVLLETRAFWRCPVWCGSTGKKWFVLRHATKHTQRPSHNDRRRRKWPHNAPHEALRLVPMHQIDGRQPPEQGNKIWGRVEMVNVPQSAPLFRRLCITATSECFEGHTPPQPPPKLDPLARGGVAHRAKMTV